jgi:hypothetical protein
MKESDDEFTITPEEAGSVEHLRGSFVIFDDGEEWCYLDGPPPWPPIKNGQPQPEQPPADSK